MASSVPSVVRFRLSLQSQPPHHTPARSQATPRYTSPERVPTTTSATPLTACRLTSRPAPCVPPPPAPRPAPRACSEALPPPPLRLLSGFPSRWFSRSRSPRAQPPLLALPSTRCCQAPLWRATRYAGARNPSAAAQLRATSAAPPRLTQAGPRRVAARECACLSPPSSPRRRSCRACARRSLPESCSRASDWHSRPPAGAYSRPLLSSTSAAFGP